MWKEFKAFIMRGNVLDLAVAVIIGAAFTSVVNSLVDDVIMPPLGLLLGGVDFTNLFIVLKEGTEAAAPSPSLEAASAAGAVTINYGVFFNAILTFLVVAFAVFLLVRQINRLRREEPVAPTDKVCAFCSMAIPIQARRCPHCTSELAGV